MENDNQKESKKHRLLGKIVIILLILFICWFSFTLYEMYRVKTDRSTLICLSKTKDVEDDDEYATVCYGLLYKYKEYFYNDTNKMSAREFTMFFTDFKREVQTYNKG